VAAYRADGFIPEAFVNYLAFLGWSTGTEEEVLSQAELIERFELSKVNRAGAVFDRDRLEWLNGQWIRRLSADDLIDRLRPFLAAELAAGRIDWMPSDDEMRRLLPVVQERLPTLAAVGDLIQFLFTENVDPTVALIVPKRWDAVTTSAGLSAARRTIVETGRDSWLAHEIEAPLRALADGRGWKAGDLFMAIRVAVTGRTATPPLFDTMVALGYERTLARLDRAIQKLVDVAGPDQ
jgi:glutamyl-tRNA synthetase